MSDDEFSEQSAQFLRAASAKEPGYSKFVEALKDAKRFASDKKISEPHVRGAISEVFGVELKDPD